MTERKSVRVRQRKREREGRRERGRYVEKAGDRENDDKWSGGWFSRRRDERGQVVGSIRGCLGVDYR